MKEKRNKSKSIGESRLLDLFYFDDCSRIKFRYERYLSFRIGFLVWERAIFSERLADSAKN